MSGVIEFSNVCGSDTLVARGITAAFTARKSCTKRHSPDALFIGKMGALHGDASAFLKIPSS